ncbi:hypothetical protein BKA70DRAFT_1301838 [Coprinopsis sp. MPI-PUGE-AT-0042]|nr:hypothetical protein BKA70DRAFT_1301838 [Coprinopsis sp. MPI-PUGE-AT-0042]
MAKTPLTPQAQRLRTIIVALPILVASSVVLYKREKLGEPRRTLPKPTDDPQTLKSTQLNPPPSQQKDL